MSDEPEDTPATPGEPPNEAIEAGLASALDPAPDAGAVEAFHQRARLAEDRLEEVLAAYRRLKGENEQHRDRVSRNAERRFTERRERLLLRFIEILDNLDRALEASERSYATESLIDGLILVRTQLLQTLQSEGLDRIAVLGLPFDPQTSEAVETQEVDDPDHHHLVVRELLRGYRLDANLVRPARVVVGEYRGVEPPEPVETPAPREEPAPEPATDVAEEEEEDASVEDIVARAQAREALFPEAFDEEEVPADEVDDDEND